MVLVIVMVMMVLMLVMGTVTVTVMLATRRNEIYKITFNCGDGPTTKAWPQCHLGLQKWPVRTRNSKPFRTN